MPTKVGSISSVGRTGARFVEAYLDSGERVELKHALWDHVGATYRPGQQLVFVERRGRLFRFVHWAGTLEEANEALASGVLAPDEVPMAARRNQASDGETDVSRDRGSRIQTDSTLAVPDRHEASDVDRFFVELEALSPEQWMQAVLAFVQVQMVREDAQSVAWQSAMEASRKALERSALSPVQVRKTNERGKAAVAKGFPAMQHSTPQYEAFRTAASDMVTGAALSLLLADHLPAGTVHILYEPFRNLIVPQAQDAPGEGSAEAPDWVVLAQSAYLGLAGSSAAGQMEHFVKRLWEIAERAPFPELAVHVRLLAQGKDEQSTEQGLFGVMDWIQATLEQGGSGAMRNAVAKSLAESSTWSQRRP